MADASIYSMIRPAVAAVDPMAQMGQAMNIKALMGQQSTQELQRRQLERAIADEDATSAAYREAAGDPVKVRDILYGRGLYKPAMAAEKAALETREKTANIGKTEAETGRARAETLLKHSTFLRDRLAGVNDQAGYTAWIEEGARLFGPEVARSTPPQFSPEVKQQLLAKAEDLIVPLAKQLEIATTRRGQDMTAETTRRGQDVSAATAREGHRVTMRGQDIGADTARRAQDLTANKEKLPTDTENVSAGYASRMATSGKIIDDLEKKGTGKPGYLESLYRSVGAETAANTSQILDPQRQQYRQAQEDWVRAKLRKESGAVIAADEMDREIRVYFPMIGDSESVVKQKAESRKVAERAMKQAAGKAKVEGGSPSAPTAPAAPRARNPQTGAEVEWNGTAWVPVSG